MRDGGIWIRTRSDKHLVAHFKGWVQGESPAYPSGDKLALISPRHERPWLPRYRTHNYSVRSRSSPITAIHIRVMCNNQTYPDWTNACRLSIMINNWTTRNRRRLTPSGNEELKLKKEKNWVKIQAMDRNWYDYETFHSPPRCTAYHPDVVELVRLGVLNLSISLNSVAIHIAPTVGGDTFASSGRSISIALIITLHRLY